MKNRFVNLWIIWTLVGAGLIYGVAASDAKKSMIAIIANVLSIAPLIGLMLAFGSVKAFRQFSDWLERGRNSMYYVAGGITILFMLPGIMTLQFDPYYSVIFATIVCAGLGVLKQSRNQVFTFGWSDLLLWLVLWIPFDLRWYMGMLPAGIDSYAWWSVALSVIAVIGWHGYRGADIGYNLVPKLRDLRIALLALVMIMVVVAPPGLLTGFLTFSIPKSFNATKIIFSFVGLFLTVALPEELFFRGILLRGLEKQFSRKWIPLVISSLAFGLMHWNNASTLSTQITYISLAAFAGVGYGWTYRKSGNNLLAAILVHTLVDWTWRIFLTT